MLVMAARILGALYPETQVSICLCNIMGFFFRPMFPDSFFTINIVPRVGFGGGEGLREGPDDVYL